MGMEFNIQEAQAVIQRLRDNVTAARTASAVSVLTSGADTIKDGGDGWAPFKRLPKRPHNLLWDTGALIQSLNVGGAGNIFEQEDAQTTVGSNLRYAAAQNYGFPPHGLPARPFLVLTGKVEDDALQAFETALMRGLT